MYFLKTKGTGQIPDFVQLRDDSFALIAHFKLSDLDKNLKNFFITEEKQKFISKIIKNAEFDKIFKIPLDE